jgi:glycosyltransferase involved in cell wall biosynthesis
MKISLINALFPPNSHGGAENYVFRTAKTLQKRGHSVSVLTTKPFRNLGSLKPERTVYEGINIWRFFPLNLSQRGQGTGDNLLAKAAWHVIDTANPHAPRAVGSLLDRLRPDVVHTNNLMGISTGIGRTIQRRGIRHVHTLHDYSLICPKSNLLRDFTAPDDELVVCEGPRYLAEHTPGASVVFSVNPTSSPGRAST